mmetsp:Transcript_3500/g.7623  ORF Transcript_3500/g.7623 Transcript_3500/m.7623 type:complete len:763 (-) Transcript_3500:160-2448(-)
MIRRRTNPPSRSPKMWTVLRVGLSLVLATTLCTVPATGVHASAEGDISRPIRLRQSTLARDNGGFGVIATSSGGGTLHKMVDLGANTINRWEQGRDLGKKKKKKTKKSSKNKKSKDGKSEKAKAKGKKEKKNAKKEKARRKRENNRNKKRNSEDGSGGGKKNKKRRHGSKTKEAAKARAQDLMDEENAIFLEAFAAAARGGGMSTPGPPTSPPPRPTPRPPTPQRPEANDIRATTVSSSTVSDNVLRNDSGDSIALVTIEDETVTDVTTITLNSGAVVTIQPDGDFIYDPSGAYDSLAGKQSAIDTFDYTIADSRGATASATVFVTVTAVNAPPIANDDSYRTTADENIRNQNVLSNDSDPNGDPIQVTFIDDVPLNGQPVTVELSSGAEITIRPATPFVYRPGDAFDDLGEGDTADDVFEYTIADPDGETDTATVTITVVGVASPNVPTPSPLPCNLTPQERRNEITAELSEVSNSADFASQGSPQRRALDFIIDDDLQQLCPDDPTLAQRYIAVVFYYSTDGPDWTECSAPDDISDPTAVAEANASCSIRGDGSQLAGDKAWLTDVTECEWGGITCDNNGNVVSLFLEDNNLAGTLPFELQDLSILRILHVEEGQTSGTIPAEYANIRTLEELDLNFNVIRGTIPEGLYQLNNLVELDLNDNQLSGTINPAVGNMPNLQFFQLQNNLVEGTVPVEIGQLDRLVIFNIDDNRFTGTMPQEVCDRRNINPGGTLASLTADCLNPDATFYIQCDTPECCTMCF